MKSIIPLLSSLKVIANLPMEQGRTAFSRRRAHSSALPSNSSRVQTIAILLPKMFGITLLVLCFLLCQSFGEEQISPLVPVAGVVRDPSGAVVPGAKVSLQAKTGDGKYDGQTDREGNFQFGNVTPEEYHLTVLADGFKQYYATLRSATLRERVEVSLSFAELQTNIVVSATRTETAAQDVGTSLTVITGETLEQMRSTSLLEALREVPGFTILQTGGRGGMTSLFARGGESDFNKVLLDGFPVNDIGGLFNFAHLTSHGVERVEALHGPTSALFGPDAIASVVQAFSRRGETTTPQADLLAEGGSHGFFRQAARLSGLFRQVDYSATIENMNSRGRTLNDDYRNTIFGGNFGWQASSSINLRTTLRYGKSELGVPGPLRAWNDLGFPPDPDHRDRQKDLLLGITLEQRLRENWNQRLSYYHVESGQFSFDPVAQNPQDWPLNFYNHPRRRGFQYQTNARLPLHNFLSGGLDYEHEDGAIDTLKVARDNFGVYFQDQLSIHSRLYLIVGARADHNSTKTPAAILASRQSQGMPVPANNGYGLAVTPRASAAFFLVRPSGKHFLNGTRLKFNYALGIKEPRLVESFSPYESYLGNPELRPERALSLEGGVEQYFARVLGKLEINYYDNRYKDLVDYIMTGFDPVSWAVFGTFVNSEKTRARGAEVSLSTQSFRTFRVSASYNYLQSYFTESLTRPGDPIVSGKLSLLRRPKHSGNMTMTYSAQNFTLYLSNTYLGQRNDVNPVFVWGMPGTLVNESFNKLDLGLTCRIHPRISFITRIDNLLNRKYEEVLGYPAYRLNFSSGLQARLGGK